MKIFAIALVVATATAQAAGTSFDPINLDRPGALEAIAKDNPTHHRRIVDIIRVAEELPCNLVPETIQTRFDARGVGCIPIMELTSDPPKRHIRFTLDETVYVATRSEEHTSELQSQF